MEYFENIKAVLNNGSLALLRGETDEYRRSLRLISKLIRDLAVVGEVDTSLELQTLWYQTLVKQVESEDNYRYAFGWHHEELHNAGSSRRDGARYNESRDNIAFVVPNGVLLGHTQVLLQILRDWRRRGKDVNPHVLSLSSFSPELADPLRSLSVPIAAPLSLTLRPVAAIEWCRSVVRELQCQTAVWVSVPIWSSYALGSRLASRQVFWSLKFHPFHHGTDVTHIAMTPPGSGPCFMSGGPWHRFSPPLTIPFNRRGEREISDLRNAINGDFIFGSLARTEKFNSRSFARVAADIVSRCAGSVFVYTGHSDSVVLRQEFGKLGISGRARYVGWVDTELYSQSIDVFLETFPFGCGLTGAQAVNCGTPMISLWCPETLPRYYFSSLADSQRAAVHWRIVENETDYRDAAVSVFQQSTGLARSDSKVGVLADIDSNKADEFLRLITTDQPV